MELEDLVLKHYRVGMRDSKVVAIEDEEGCYKAPSAEALEKALNTRCRIRMEDNLFVRSSRHGQWRRMARATRR